MGDQAQVAVIGAGPSGVACAAALANRGISAVCFDRGALGATILKMPPGMRFFSSPENLSYFGLPVPAAADRCTREEFLFYIRQMAQQAGLTVRSFEDVEAIRGGKGEFTLSTRTLSGLIRTFRSERIVLATGDCVLPHLLCVPGEDLPHVSHYPADPARYVRREVLVVGGRNSAVETCLRLHHAGARITLAHRGVNLDKQIIKYWLYPEISHLIKQGLIRARFGTCLVKIEPDGATLQGPSGGEKVACDDVLLLTGYGPDTTLLKALGVVLEGEGGVPRHDPRTLETNVPGVHVCGTAVAGRQTRFTVYIENTRDHPAKIAEALARDLRP